MSRYTEIELTSRGEDGSWRWRAAGARQPRGIVGADLVPGDAKVGDVVRAETESGIEGVEVISIIAAKAPRREEGRGTRIEMIAPPPKGPDVSVILAGGSRGRGADHRAEWRDGERSGPHARERAQGRRGPRRADLTDRDGRDRAKTGGEQDTRESSQRGRRSRPAAAGEGARPSTRGSRSREIASSDDRDGRSRVGSRRPRNLPASTTHRNAMLAELRPEQLPIAEQLLRGGIPAVRQAIEEQNANARRQGQPAVGPEPLVAMAEELLPLVNLATWKDRASVAQIEGKELRLRELRAVVAASRTVTLDESGRTLAKALQDSLTERAKAVQDEWIGRMSGALDEGKILEALRASARPPEASTRCPADLAVRLAGAASAAMSAEIPSQEWLELLKAVLESPVRRTVKPAGMPEGDDVKEASRNAAGLVPALVKMTGLRIPPPPPRRDLRREPATAKSGGGPVVAP